MTNEEMQAKYESLNSIEDAYALMQENGYSGSLQDFEALCAKASDEIGPMELDDMDAVAGGVSWEGFKEGASDAWDATKGALSKGWNWVKENPTLTASLAGNVVAAAIGITCGVKYLRGRNQVQDNVTENVDAQQPALRVLPFASLKYETNECSYCSNCNAEKHEHSQITTGTMSADDTQCSHVTTKLLSKILH